MLFQLATIQFSWLILRVKVKVRCMLDANQILHRLLILFRMTMSQENTKILQKNGPMLIEHMDIEHTLLPKLLARKVITRPQMEDIRTYLLVC